MLKKCTPLWREAHLQVKMYKTLESRTTFGGSDVEKVHAVVARSTFASQNVQSTRVSDHFWRFRCRRAVVARSTFGSLGALLEVEMSKKCTSLWREAHFEVKMLKTPGVSDHFWRFRCRFASLHYTTLHYTTLHYTRLHSTTLHYTTLPSITLRYTKLHYIPLHSTTLHYITLNDTAPQIDS